MKKATTKSSAAKSAARGSKDAPVRQRAKRLPAAERRSLIMKEAGVFFSQHGFAASTRDLADRLGVRQALLYKYFTSKENLIETVFDEAFNDHWTLKWAQSLANRATPLEERLRAFYSGYSDLPEDPDAQRLRLFLRGALDGYPLPARIAPLLAKGFVNPLVSELRSLEGLPDLATKGLMKGERELVMMLHGSVIFYHIRSHVYKAPGIAEREPVTSLFIDLWLRGARASLKALHGGGDAALTGAQC